ncbi:hypothetical protein FHS77_003182 [Paenochrobactrum gallinarii]|uniref:Matrixin family metalloprotease n=1 Tax=Paenochrobactrum gallinarii TaxID=643673 RepID=A0A841M8Q5_9HYPH|nr:hypothetical protein [Paenochrobactrum gallinarii]MBB6262601.1 hypothetical protein [Paenochrobactrum gallinarii]
MFDSNNQLAVSLAPETEGLSRFNGLLTYRHVPTITAGTYFPAAHSITDSAWEKFEKNIKKELSQKEKVKILYYAILMHEMGHLLGHSHPLMPAQSRTSIVLNDDFYDLRDRRFIFNIPPENQSTAPIMDTAVTSYIDNRRHQLGRLIDSVDDIIPAPVEVQAVNTICLTGSSQSLKKRAANASTSCPAFTLDKVIATNKIKTLPAALYNILR